MKQVFANHQFFFLYKMADEVNFIRHKA